MGSFFRAMKRMGRSALSILIAGTLAKVTEEPKMIIFAPLIQAAAKYLREKTGIKYLPL